MAKIINEASGFTQEAIMTLKTNKSAIYMTNKFAMHTDALESYYDGSISMLNAFVTTKNEDNDTYTFSKMLQEEDRSAVVQAIMGELDDHNKRGHWKIMNRWNMPKNTKTIMSISSFKRKGFRMAD